MTSHDKVLAPSTSNYLERLHARAPANVLNWRGSMRYGDQLKYVTVNVNVKEYPDGIEIVHITDTQFGHLSCNVPKLIEFFDWILSKRNRFVVLGGDMVDAATVLSVASPYENTEEPQGQVYRFVELAMRIRHRIIGYVGGNHERRSCKAFGDLGILIATLLRVPYSSGKQFVDINYGKHKPFKISLWHGGSGARTKGSKMQMLHRFMTQGEGQLYMVGHLHDAMMTFDWRERRKGGKISLEKFAGVMSSSFLEHYGCLDEDTECLTSAGWKKHADILPNEIVATMKTETKAIEWQQIKGKHVYDYFGEMAHVTNTNMDMLITPNHRVVYRNRYKDEVEVRRMDEMPLENGHIGIMHGGTLPSLGESQVSPALASVLGWFLSEGYYRKDGGSGISQSERVHPRYTKAIGLALEKAGLKFSIHRGTKGIVNFYLPKTETDKFKAIIPEKLLTAELVTSLGKREARKLFCALMRGDGHFGKKRSDWTWIQKSKHNRDMFQILAMRLGIACSLVGERFVSVKMLLETGWRKMQSSPVFWIPHYAGKVWCLSVPNTTFIARRNGQTFVTGNTYAEVAGMAATDTAMWRVILEPDGRWMLTVR